MASVATCSLTGVKDVSVGRDASKGASSDMLPISPERRLDDSLEVDERPNSGADFYNFT